MDAKPLDRNLLAEQLGRTATATPGEVAALRTSDIVFAGYGSVARPLGEALATRGAPKFALIDPKSYGPRSVASQCVPDEVGRMKADVGAERLQVLGADVTSYGRDLYSVPAGIMTNDALVIASMDNRRGDIRANRWAAAVGARLLKINLEPALQTVALRAFDYRDAVSQCVECQFTRRHYQQQRHPRSCDGPGTGRRTNSPRWLSQLAGFLGTLAVLDLVHDADGAQCWFGNEWQYCHATGKLQCSQLTTNPDCRCDHARRWSHVQRLTAGPQELRLRTLLQESGARDTARVRFCQQVSLQASCRDCTTAAKTPRWFCQAGEPVGSCSECGGWMEPIPFWSYSELAAGQLAAVVDHPLAAWGVEPNAMIEVRTDRGAVTFVIGNPAGRKRFHAHPAGGAS